MPNPFQTIYLASASQRRRELLKQISVHFEVLLLRVHPSRAEVDETPRPGEDPHEYVLRLARAKAEAGCAAMCARRLPAYPVLA
jgi:septum formation protein